MTRFIARPSTQRGILLLALFALLSYLASRDARQELQAPEGDVDTRLNYALFDFKAKLLDAQGQLAATIQAPLLQNNASTGVGTVTEPDVFMRESGFDWHIKADSAVVSADREFVSMSGDVHIRRYNALTSDLLEVDTNDLLVAITPRTATTDAPVTLDHAGDHLAATGMKLDMINDKFELLADVSAIYDTP